jgi:hypothetical protein
MQVLQYKTDQQADIKKLDDLQAFLLSLMAGMAPDDLVSIGEAQADAAPAAAAKAKRSKRRN